MADRIHRVTMFKLPGKEDQQRLIAQYKILAANQQKEGKPYILSVVVGPAEDDPKTQGYTVVAKTEFASLDDMKYYDAGCAAHQALRAFAVAELGLKGPPLSVYFSPQAISVL